MHVFFYAGPHPVLKGGYIQVKKMFCPKAEEPHIVVSARVQQGLFSLRGHPFLSD